MFIQKLRIAVSVSTDWLYKSPLSNLLKTVSNNLNIKKKKKKKERKEEMQEIVPLNHLPHRKCLITYSS